MENQISTHCSFLYRLAHPWFLEIVFICEVGMSMCMFPLRGYQQFLMWNKVVLANETNATTFQLIYMQDLPLILWISVALIGVVLVIQQDVSVCQRTQRWYWSSHSFHNRSIVYLKISSMVECCSYDGDWELL